MGYVNFVGGRVAGTRKAFIPAPDCQHDANSNHETNPAGGENCIVGAVLAVAIKAAKAQEHRLQAGMDARQAPATAPAMAGTNVANILEPHTPVPEPSSLVLGGAGIGAMLVLRRLLFR